MYPDISKTFIKAIAISLLLLAVFSSTGAQEQLPAVDKLLAAIARYEYGQSREPLSELSDIVNSVHGSPELVAELQDRMLKVLDSDATGAGKQFICRQLSLIGSEKAVPVLAKMLLKIDTSDMARYALERIPGRKVDKALRKALEKTSGDVQVGIINSLGQRRDVKSVKILAKRIDNPDPEIAEAAVNALGKIAGPDATDILAKAKEKTTGALQKSVLDAYLKCADRLTESGETGQAGAIYMEIFDSGYSGDIRAVALRGMVRSSHNQADLLVPLVKSTSDIQTAAIDLVRDMPKTEDTLPISGLLHELSPPAQIRLIAALADRGDKAALQDIRIAALSATLQVRVAAINAIGVLGDAADVDFIAKAATSEENEEKEEARKTLYVLRGRDIDQAILTKMPGAKPDQKVELIRSIVNRGMDSALEGLLESAQDSSRQVKIEAFKALAEVAPPSSQPELIALLLAAPNSAVRREAEKCLTAVANKLIDREKRADEILAILPEVTDNEKRESLLQVLGNIGCAKSLPVLRETLKADSESLQAAAIRALSQWPDQGAADDLLGVATTSKNETFRILALRGYIGLVDLGENEAAKIGMYKTAMELSTEVNEKRQVLSGLAKVKSPLSIDMAMEYLADSDLKPEAVAALGTIAWEIRDTHPEDAIRALKKVVEMTENESQRDNAQRLLDRIENQQ